MHFRASIVSLAALSVIVTDSTAQVSRAPASPAARLAAFTADTTALSALHWRAIGPLRGGRSVAAAGSAQRPLEYYMGSTSGVFKTADAGITWTPVSDKYFGGTIGSIEVDPSNPDVVWVGGGETCIRGNVSHGEGVWRSPDAGKTWQYMGLRETEQIAVVKVSPRDPNTVFVAALGKVHAPSADRGVYKSTDGGKVWKKVLFRNDSTGAIDLVMDASNSDVMYAALWQAGRTPWSMSSGGIHSGIFKSTDAGEHWTEITGNLKLPNNVIGKIGLAVAPTNSQRVWALVENDSGGVYRSDDAGQTWRYLNRERKLRQRAWYYTHIFADPKDPDVVYALNTSMYKSTDGGVTFPNRIAEPHGDNHDLWIAPNDPQRMVETNDGGANVSFDGGKSWSRQTFATAQFYHVATTNEFPYKVCGAQQDNSSLCGPSRKVGGITIADWYDAGGGESGYIAPKPDQPNITYAGSYGGLLTRRDRETGFQRDVTVFPINPMGWSSKDIPVRFQWTYPIVFSRHNPNVLYAAGNFLFRSTDGGDSWKKVSPDLSRHDPKTMNASGGPITKDQTGVETYALIFAFDESPVKQGLLWAGTDDGYVWVSQDNGARWTNVTPLDIGDFTRISIIEPSHFGACSAFVAANRYQLDDKRPILYKTADCGKSWTKIVEGIPNTEFTRVIREDPVRRGLLFAGTERGVWMSFDDGGKWQSLQRNLPPTPVHDLTIKDGDLIAASHGRAFWIMDDLSPLRQLSPAIVAKPAHLFLPRDTYRVNWGDGGFNPPSGVIVNYWLAAPKQSVALDFLDAAGTVIRSFASGTDSTMKADSLASAAKVATPKRLTNTVGVNQFAWNLRYPDAAGFSKLIMWSGDTIGPIAPPGTYAVRMRVGDAPLETQRFLVKKDPRSIATQADLEAQFKFLIAVRDKLSAVNNSIRTVRNVRFQVAEREPLIASKPQGPEFERLAKQLEEHTGAAERNLYQTKNESPQDPLNFPIRLNDQIAGLSSVAGGEYRPTSQALDAFTTLSRRADLEIAAAKSAIDKLVPGMNTLLRAAGLNAIVVGTTELKPPTIHP